MKKIFIIPVLIFLSFLVFLYVALPQIANTNKAKKNFSIIEEELIARQKYFKGLQSSLEEMAAYKNTLEKIEGSLPGEISLFTLIDFFNKKADDNGLVLESLAPITGPAVSQDIQGANPAGEGMLQDKKAPAQYFSLVLGGSVISFESFLKDIETSARLIDVESISLQQNLGELSSSIDLTIKVYY